MSDFERRVQQALRVCEHFTGIQHDTCKAGVNYRALVGVNACGWSKRLPCTRTRYTGEPVPCDLKTLPTRSDVEAREREMDALVADVLRRLASGEPMPAGVIVCREEDMEP